MFGTDKTKWDLEIVILEVRTVTESCKANCKSCYTLEGDLPFFFTSAEVLKDIESQIYS